MHLRQPSRAPGARPRLEEGRDAIAAAIERLLRALDEDQGEAAARRLQTLVDRFLARGPACSVAQLERRLLGLARALEELGPWAADDELISHAIASDRLH